MGQIATSVEHSRNVYIQPLRDVVGVLGIHAPDSRGLYRAEAANLPYWLVNLVSLSELRIHEPVSARLSCGRGSSAAKSSVSVVQSQSVVFWRQHITNGKPALAHWISEGETRFG
jgi:hypothetical protein